MPKMKECKYCSNEIADNAKFCPKCGAKNKKPFYKRGWFIALCIFIILGMIGSNSEDSDNTLSNEKEYSNTEEVYQNPNEKEDVVIEENVSVENNIPTEYKSALKQAKTYSEKMHMSKAGIYDQLTSEYGGQFTSESAQYAIDNLDANWKENALRSAQSYQDKMSMSPNAIYDQLISEYGGQFTEEEAQYAIDNLE